MSNVGVFILNRRSLDRLEAAYDQLVTLLLLRLRSPSDAGNMQASTDTDPCNHAGCLRIRPFVMLSQYYRKSQTSTFAMRAHSRRPIEENLQRPYSAYPIMPTDSCLVLGQGGACGVMQVALGRECFAPSLPIIEISLTSPTSMRLLAQEQAHRSGGRGPVSGFTAVLFPHPDFRHHHPPINRLAHIINSQQPNLHSRQRLHFDASLAIRLHLRAAVDG